MLTFRARYFKDKITQGREYLSGVFILYFLQDIRYKSGLSLDENVQTCDAFILFNGPLRSFKHGVLKEIPSLAVNPRRAEHRRKACQSKSSSFFTT